MATRALKSARSAAATEPSPARACSSSESTLSSTTARVCSGFSASVAVTGMRSYSWMAYPSDMAL
jgi:hypothetical protein